MIGCRLVRWLVGAAMDLAFGEVDWDVDAYESRTTKEAA